MLKCECMILLVTLVLGFVAILMKMLPLNLPREGCSIVYISCFMAIEFWVLCVQELAGVPAVLSVQPDKKVESENKDYGGDHIINSADSSEASQITPVKTKKLFITGLSFYTSEKTLRAAFEGFVKIIMDKISKRSKGYAFVEYTTEEEMNGKIINGWMIVVDVAKSNPPRYSRGQPRPTA